MYCSASGTVVVGTIVEPTVHGVPENDAGAATAVLDDGVVVAEGGAGLPTALRLGTAVRNTAPG